MMKTDSTICSPLKPYRCANSSKCIALSQLVDGFPDCFQEDDEMKTNGCSVSDVEYRFRCVSEEKCIPMSRFHGKIPLCIGQEDRKPGRWHQMTFYRSFTMLCDGFVDNYVLDGLNYTDEMDCENWPCHNFYTQCDKTWNCRNAEYFSNISERIGDNFQ